MAWQPSSFEPESFQPDSIPSARNPVAASPRTTMLGGALRPTMDNFGEISASLLPMAGGMAGGFVGAPAGPPGMVAGAALGGAGGEAVRQLWEHAMASLAPQSGVRGPATPAEAMGKVSRAGVEQGAAEAGGQVLAAGARAAAPHLMRYGLKSPPAKTRMAANRGGGEPDFTRVAKTALEERAPSLGRARSRLREANLETEKRIGASVGRGEKFYITEAAQPMIEQAEKSLGRKLTAKERAAVVGRARDAVADILEDVRGFKPANKQTAFTAAEGRLIKREAQERALPEYQAKSSGRRRPPTRGEFANVAMGNHRAVDRLADTAPADARTAELIMLEDALQNRAAQSGFHPTMLQSLGMLGAGGAGALGHGVEGAGLGAAGAYLLGSPTAARYGAHVMTDPTIQWLLSQTPRSAVFGLNRFNEDR